MSTETIQREQSPSFNNLPNRLREFRKRAGLTQIQLANKLGVKQNNLSTAETTGVGLSNDTWFRLSHIFNVDPRALRGWQPPEEDEPIIPVIA